ncbi:hypothetical protein ABZP36_001541, partial [Zizania latifolia]
MGYRSILPKDEYHKLADETIQDLLEKLEDVDIMKNYILKIQQLEGDLMRQ